MRLKAVGRSARHAHSKQWTCWANHSLTLGADGPFPGTAAASPQLLVRRRADAARFAHLLAVVIVEDARGLSARFRTFGAIWPSDVAFAARTQVPLFGHARTPNAAARIVADVVEEVFHRDNANAVLGCIVYHFRLLFGNSLEGLGLVRLCLRKIGNLADNEELCGNRDISIPRMTLTLVVDFVHDFAVGRIDQFVQHVAIADS